MKKISSFALSLLTGAILAGSSIPGTQAQPTPTTTPAPQQPASPSLTLTSEDLGPGFGELPPDLAAQIQARFELLTQQLARAGIKPDKYFAFANAKSGEIVIGFTGMLSEQAQQQNFDTVIKQYQEPEFQQETLKQIRASLKPSDGIEILEMQPLPTVNNSVAESSTGISVAISMQGQPLRIDLAAFRRSGVGAFTAIMYRNGEKPTLQLTDVAKKLDNRIVQASSVTPAGAIDPGTNNSDREMNPSNTPNTPNTPNTTDPGVTRPETTETK